MAEWIALLFGTKATLSLLHIDLEGNWSFSKNKHTSSWNFAPNSGLRKIWQTTIASLSAWAYIFVYNMMYMIQHITWVCWQ